MKKANFLFDQTDLCHVESIHFHRIAHGIDEGFPSIRHDIQVPRRLAKPNFFQSIFILLCLRRIIAGENLFLLTAIGFPRMNSIHLLVAGL